MSENVWISLNISLKFVPEVQINNVIGSDNGLAGNRRQSHFSNQWWLVYWRIYASLGLNELIYSSGWSNGMNWVTELESMMTSSNGNIFRVTGPLCGQFTGHRWISLTKTCDAALEFFLSAHEQTTEQTIVTLVIWDVIALIMPPP